MVTYLTGVDKAEFVSLLPRNQLITDALCRLRGRRIVKAVAHVNDEMVAEVMLLVLQELPQGVKKRTYIRLILYPKADFDEKLSLTPASEDEV